MFLAPAVGGLVTRVFVSIGLKNEVFGASPYEGALHAVGKLLVTQLLNSFLRLSKHSYFDVGGLCLSVRGGSLV